MKLRVTIDMNNAAFTESDGAAGVETARILRKLAGNLEQSDVLAGYAESLRDINGNTVGAATTSD